MLFRLNELELLRGVNAISTSDGGTQIGTVGKVWVDQTADDGYQIGTGRNWLRQWLISVELKDRAKDRYGSRRPIPTGQHEWYVRLGFCQSQIGRAAVGGYALEIPSSLLAVAGRADDVYDLWRCMRGATEDRLESTLCWYQRMIDEIENQPVLGWELAAMDAIVRERSLAYSDDRDLLPR